MSNFSDSILELLLSWVRGVFSDVFSIFSGDSVSIFAWLGRHWLSLVCILLIGGVTIDLLVYILRWHPQRVWLSKFKRIFDRRTTEENAFIDGYENGIDSFELDVDPQISEYINEPRFEQYETVTDAPTPQPEVTPAEDVPVRRRRSDRHVKHNRKRRIHIKLPSLDDSETPYTVYPAPPVHAREAFHSAVYPSDNTPLWQQSSENNHADK